MMMSAREDNQPVVAVHDVKNILGILPPLTV